MWYIGTIKRYCSKIHDCPEKSGREGEYMLAELERFYADYCSSIRREADALRGKMTDMTGGRVKFDKIREIYFVDKEAFQG